MSINIAPTFAYRTPSASRHPVQSLAMQTNSFDASHKATDGGFELSLRMASPEEFYRLYTTAADVPSGAEMLAGVVLRAMDDRYGTKRTGPNSY